MDPSPRAQTDGNCPNYGGRVAQDDRGSRVGVLLLLLIATGRQESRNRPDPFACAQGKLFTLLRKR
jgi:hypothetical protein